MASTEKKPVETPKPQPQGQQNDNKSTTPSDTEVKKTTGKAQYTVRPGSKMEKAIAVFNAMQGKPRQEVIEKLITEAQLTKSGAKTYFSNLTTRKRKNQI